LRKSDDFKIRADFESGKLIGVPDNSLIADGQLVAALGAAAGEYGPAIFAFHTRPETMSFCALSVVRLKCTFWHNLPDSGNATEKGGATLRHTTEEVQVSL
jgi:hypothetical protein